MSQRSKREMAPPPSQPPALQPPTPPSPFLPPPWWGAPPPHAPFPPFPMSCESMASPPGLWSGNPYAYGAQLGAAAMGDGLRVQDASGNGKADSESLDCPPGGFLNFLQNGHRSVSAASPPSGSIDQGATLRSKTKTVINVAGGDDVRTEKRLSWTPEEDVRLVSAWLYNSNDPINRNNKKNEQYWHGVYEMYNSTTPENWKRKVKNMKDRFQKIKRWVGFFCGSWKKAASIYASGQSDDQLRDKALQFYAADHPQEGPFSVMNCWKILRDEPKWHAVLDELDDKSNKRKFGDEHVAGETTDDTTEKEQLGTKEAKKQRNGKGKIKVEDPSLDEDLKKYMDIQAAAKKHHDDFLETQKCVSDANVEATRLNREAALLESYKSLMTMDTKEMTDEMKAEHVMGLKILREKLLGNTG
ncbi:hypothetical protein ACP4OV_028968 [Aristida adscensionis]